MKLSTRLQNWANYWYEFSFNEESKYNKEMQELKEIIQDLKKIGK